MRRCPAVIPPLGCLLAAAALAGCGQAGVVAPRHDAKTATGTAAATATPAGPTNAPGTSGVAKEVADPLEASSYPAPASVHHKPAATPKRAGEEFVAAGAPSDAEVRSELAQMHAAERATLQTQKKQLTPVPGGESVGGNGTIPIP